MAQSMKAPLHYRPPVSMGSNPCCSTGRPVLSDPISGRVVCSCQLQTGLPAYLSRVPSLPETVYGSNTNMGLSQTSPTEQQAHYLHMYQDRTTESLKAAPPSSQYPYYMSEQMMAAHPYGAFYPGFDINGARRKNATRETTSALKAWLHQHLKNPYPTKAEKIMLAVITQMSLTQVSTWFANARRRLKKENKLNGGSPVDLNDLDMDDVSTHNDSLSSRISESDSDSVANLTKSSAELSDVSDAEEQTTNNKPAKKCVQRLFSPDGRNELFLERIPSPGCDKVTVHKDNGSVFSSNCAIFSPAASSSEQKSELLQTSSQDIDVVTVTPSAKSQTAPVQSKPKIWSIVDIMS